MDRLSQESIDKIYDAYRLYRRIRNIPSLCDEKSYAYHVRELFWEEYYKDLRSFKDFEQQILNAMLEAFNDGIDYERARP